MIQFKTIRRIKKCIKFYITKFVNFESEIECIDIPKYTCQQCIIYFNLGYLSSTGKNYQPQ